MPTDPIYLFVHLFKTGGTTINGHLARHLTWDEEFVHLGPWGNRVRTRDGKPDPSGWPPDRWDRTRVIAGHHVTAATRDLVPHREARYLTILRDPAELLVSLYNFHASRNGPEAGFWDWYGQQPANRVTRRLRKTLDVTGPPDLRKALRRFWFVGTTPHLNDDLPHLFQAMGAPAAWVERRVAGAGDDLEDLDIGRESFPIERHVNLTDEIRARIHAEHPKDLRLYEFATELRLVMRQRLGWDAAESEPDVRPLSRPE